LASVKQLEAIERLRTAKLEREHKLINGIDHKLCNKHHIFFPNESPWVPATLEYFYYNDKNKTDYLHPNCILCGIQKMYVWREGNPDYLEKENKRTNEKYHTDNEYKQRIKNSSTERRKDGKEREWQRKHPEKLKVYNKQHSQHIISKEEWKADKEYFNNECCYCGLKIEDHYFTRLGITKNGDFHKDHMVHKGSNYLNNCVPACGSCNSSKHTDSLEDWYNIHNPNYTEARYNKIIKWCTEDYKLYFKPRKGIDVNMIT